MDRLITHLNILLICMNIVGIGTYLYARILYKQQYEYLLIIFIISISSIQRYVKHIKCHFCIIATFNVIATFIKNQKIDLVILAVTFSIAVNLGYALINRCNEEMKMKIYESILNLSFTVAVIFSIFCDYIQVSRITLKIFILVTTLPNFFLALPETQDLQQKSEENEQQQPKERRQNFKISNKLIYYLNPMLCKSWVYALGYSIGIYLNIFQIFPVILAKYVKYLIIALLIVIETLTYRQFIKLICMLFRSMLVFHYEKANLNYQCYFILLYIVLKNLLHDDALNIYLMAGYLLIAVTIWREEYRINFDEQKNQGSPLSPENPLKEPLLTELNSSRIHEKEEELKSTEENLLQTHTKIYSQSRLHSP